jgi:hypothetical protein
MGRYLPDRWHIKDNSVEPFSSARAVIFCVLTSAAHPSKLFSYLRFFVGGPMHHGVSVSLSSPTRLCRLPVSATYTLPLPACGHIFQCVANYWRRQDIFLRVRFPERSYSACLCHGARGGDCPSKCNDNASTRDLGVNSFQGRGSESSPFFQSSSIGESNVVKDLFISPPPKHQKILSGTLRGLESVFGLFFVEEEHLTGAASERIRSED